jgi:hypothetical protein
VPLVRDSDRRPHGPRHWKALEDALYRHFDGFTGPEGPVLGNYRNRSGKRVTDQSRRYTIALPLCRVEALRSLLRQVANTFDQECIYFVVGVEAELVGADPSAGNVGEV